LHAASSASNCNCIVAVRAARVKAEQWELTNVSYVMG